MTNKNNSLSNVKSLNLNNKINNELIMNKKLTDNFDNNQKVMINYKPLETLKSSYRNKSLLKKQLTAKDINKIECLYNDNSESLIILENAKKNIKIVNKKENFWTKFVSIFIPQSNCTNGLENINN